MAGDARHDLADPVESERFVEWDARQARLAFHQGDALRTRFR